MDGKFIKIVRIENGKKTLMYNIECSPESLFEEKGQYYLRILKMLIDTDKYYSNNGTEIKFELLDKNELYLEKINEYVNEKEVEVYSLRGVVSSYLKYLLDRDDENTDIKYYLQVMDKNLKYFLPENKDTMQCVYRIEKTLSEIKNKKTTKK